MTPHEHGAGQVEFPSDLEVALSRDFQAPVQLVFDVLWKPEHVRRTIAPFGEKVTALSIDLRVGGGYHYAFLTDDGVECSFRGTFLEVEQPTRTSQTWLFEGWPDAEAVESFDLHGGDGVTTLRWSLVFRDRAGRDHMTLYDGIEANFDHMEKLLASLVDPDGAASEG